VFIQHHATTGLQSYLAFLDNGSGMDVAGIEKFATLALSQKDRGQAPEIGTETGKMFIGKFGVGAKQAGFYLGDRMTLFSKPQRQDVYRFVMEVPPESDSTTSASASTITPFEGVVETLNLDALDQGHMLPLNETEKEPMCFCDMESVIKTHMKTCASGSAIVIRLHEKILKRFQNEIDLQNLSKSLKDIYHFHLNPNNGLGSVDATSARLPVQIRLDWHQYSYYQPLDVISTSLGDEVIDFLDECRINDRAPFKVTIKSPLGSKNVTISGMFWYIPFENDKEQRPPLPTKVNAEDAANSSSDTGSQAVTIDNRCIVRCYWQNRLVPWTVLHNLALFDHVEKYIKDQKANVSEFWRRRIVGVLFLDWHFEDISNNKLKFNTSLTNLLNSKHKLSYTPTSAVDVFAK
jgi:hypothetical protein